MVVNHLFQVLAFMAMEPPTALEPRSIGEEKNKVFRSLSPIEPSQVVRGQYDGLPRRARRARRTPRPRRSSRCAARSTTGVGRACRSTCAPASAWPKARASSRSRSASRRRACSRSGSGVGAHGPDHLTFDLADASRLSLSFYGKRPGPGHDSSTSRACSSRLHETGRTDRPARGVRAADLRRDERRPHAVHERGRHRELVGAVEAAAREPAAGAAVRAGLVGSERDPPTHRARRVAPPVRAGLAEELSQFRPTAGIVPMRPDWKSSMACTISARVFMRNGP